ncbi:hypothetical protein GWI33_016624 [Rhynchophorus ferrugineus]|uniref:Uncharacterized protein n=1 Tax=Rhynchophorus ferrugineus TaxID=354439 RepID=A0A834HZQ9_RHYFE|nr:hypothetical protein GWI33_016624 [Rhynchophorus ferrugineus]
MGAGTYQPQYYATEYRIIIKTDDDGIPPRNILICYLMLTSIGNCLSCCISQMLALLCGAQGLGIAQARHLVVAKCCLTFSMEIYSENFSVALSNYNLLLNSSESVAF